VIGRSNVQLQSESPDHDNSGHLEVGDDAPQPSVDKRTSIFVKSPPILHLADQYLDTMVMDDDWRNACLRQISEARRRQQSILKQLNGGNSSFSVRDHLTLPAKARTKSKVESEPVLDKPTISPKAELHNRSGSTGTDSGFFSCSPTPNSPMVLATRSTRTGHKSIATSVDDQPRKDGRRCLSCKSRNTSCWRRAFGGIICNSCGLR
jgi:hypothetical protein